MPACLCAVVAAGIVVEMAERIILSHPMIVYTSRQVGAILHNMRTQHMTVQRRSGYEAIAGHKNLTTQPTSSINPALLGVLGMADMIDDFLAAELVRRGCKLMAGKRVTIYTDSKYAWGVVHHFAKTWEARDVKTVDGKPIAHSNLIGQLTESVQLPAEVAIVKVKGHAAGDDEQTVGNRKADEAAKLAAKAQIKPPFDMGNKHQVTMAVHITNVPEIDIKILQSQPTQTDLEHWSKHGCASDKDGILCSNAERLKNTIKGQLTKAVLETGKKWVDLLPAELTEIRMTPSSTIKLSPFEILMDRPFPTPWVKGHTGIASLGDLEVIQEDYVTSLIEKLTSICADVSLCVPLPSEKPTHPFVPGQSVLIKSLKMMRVGEPRYLGPTTVIAVTRTGVLTDYQPQWIHASRGGGKTLTKLRKELPLIVRFESQVQQGLKVVGVNNQRSLHPQYHKIVASLDQAVAFRITGTIVGDDRVKGTLPCLSGHLSALCP
ncbi:Gag-Pol polyprotein [Labeo rohita]|uniref:Gag-Pol polyprotein n=1 Tax=Labeo rohita TaxID=84645 RepID=A0ABQ8MVS8_LABRO|nr:Gag-Pol polyprotein [Labeo rohita]